MPLHASLDRLPPAFLVVPECDVLFDENMVFAERLRAAGVETEAKSYRGATHSFLEAMSIADVARRAIRESSDWLRERLEGRRG